MHVVNSTNTARNRPVSAPPPTPRKPHIRPVSRTQRSERPSRFAGGGEPADHSALPIVYIGVTVVHIRCVRSQACWPWQELGLEGI